MKKRKPEYKPLLFTTTVRNPKRMKGLLNILSKFNEKKLTDGSATRIVGELIKYGLYRPMKKTKSIKAKWKGTKNGEFSALLLSNEEVAEMLQNNPQRHKEAGFAKGWSSRFATIFDFAKELGFVYYQPNEKIIFSRIGLKLANSINVEISDNVIIASDAHPEFEQQAFLHALAKYQRNNPFVRVLNDNVPLVLLLEVIKNLNADKDFNSVGISKLELPLIIFWKNNDADQLYKRIKKIRKDYGYNPSSEVIIDICRNEIMEGKFKKFKPKSIMTELPDEFIRKMRATGLISLRGAGRFIDINKNEIYMVDYILKNYSTYTKYSAEKEYFDYMAKVDNNLISFSSKSLSISDKETSLNSWLTNYSWDLIKKELSLLAKKGLSKDNVLKYLPSPVRLEFLTALAVKSKFPDVRVIPNYPCDDTGLPTSTAAGVGDKGDIECYEDINGVLIEVTMTEGTVQTKMEAWPVGRHLEEFGKNAKESMCYFIAPSIYRDSKDQFGWLKDRKNLEVLSKTIKEFLEHIDKAPTLYRKV